MRKRGYPPSPQCLVRVSETPLGPITLFFTGRGLAALDFAEGTSAREADPPAALAPLITAAEEELARYFTGAPTDFSSLCLDLQGTPFQLRVWQELRKIPRGAAISYQELAARVGNLKAVRAVGQANARNPLPLIIPCHRVIAADGSLGGYSSGLDRKRWLLRHEGTLGVESGERPGT